MIHRNPDAWRSNRHGLPPGMSPAERIAARVRHRVRESERRALRGHVEQIASMAGEIEELRASDRIGSHRSAIGSPSDRDGPRVVSLVDGQVRVSGPGPD